MRSVAHANFPFAFTTPTMTELLSHYGLFLAKTLTLVLALGVLVALIARAVRSGDAEPGGEQLRVRNLNERFRQLADALHDEILDDESYKALLKQRKREAKARAKQPSVTRPRVFALQFHGDIRASAVDNLREEISAVLQVARPGQDEVLLRLDSEGGMVHGYGLAASQLVRLRDAGIKLTCAVDKVAASGGYMMACVAERIIAAPFAILGSIGVVAQLPNFNRLLKRMDVDYELHTAGDFKRTLTLFGENTEAAREKFRTEIEETHELFKSFVHQYRGQLDMQRIATGEHWYGTQALALRLVDELKTSDDYLLARSREADLYELSYRRRQNLAQRLAQGMVRLGLGLRHSLEQTTLPRWQ